MRIENSIYFGTLLIALSTFFLKPEGNLITYTVIAVMIFGIYHFVRVRYNNRKIQADIVLRIKTKKYVEILIGSIALLLLGYFSNNPLLIIMLVVMLIEEAIFQKSKNKREPVYSIDSEGICFFGLINKKISFAEINEISYNGFTDKIGIYGKSKTYIKSSDFSSSDVQEFLDFLMSRLPEETKVEKNLILRLDSMNNKTAGNKSYI